MKNFYINSFDETKLYVYLWDEVAEPKGVVQLSHGMGEHAGRYGELAKRLNGAGYVVFADDHRAHGLSETDEERGHHGGDIFGDTVKDLVFLHHYFREKYNLPMFFIGHSYGSFLGQAFLEQETEIKGMVMVGSAKMDGAKMAFGMVAASGLNLVASKWRPQFLRDFSEKKRNKGFPYDDGDVDKRWLTTDLALREAAVDDTLSGVNMSVGFNFSMMRGLYRLSLRKNEARINPYVKLLLLSGGDDPIGESGRLVEKLFDYYKNLGVKDVEMKLYEGARHEVFNEKCRDAVYSDVIRWLNCCK